MTLLFEVPTRWHEPLSPSQPHPDPLTVTTVPHAYLSPVAFGRLASELPPRGWRMGAVYTAQGRLVPSSQKVVASREVPRVPADPVRRRVPQVRRDQRLAGRWLYGGTYASAYGHFITETLTTLWPSPAEREGIRGLVFHGNHQLTGPLREWHLRYLELAGFGGLPVHVVGQRTGRVVEELVVPDRALALHAWVRPEARMVWDTIASPFRDPSGPERVFISRTSVNRRRAVRGRRRQPRTADIYDEGLDRVFADHGFRVIRPEQLGVDEQLAVIAGAQCLAGQSGSGLHQSAFLVPGRRVVEIGDSRTVDRPVSMQVAIDAACGHERAFLSGRSAVEEVDAALTALGL